MSSRGNLHRSKEGKVIAGVSAGLGEYFDVDPVIFRVLFILLIFADWVGLIVYAILWIALPLSPHKEPIREI